MNNVYTLLLAPRPAGEARATSIPGVVCKERATKPAGLRAAARRGAAAGGQKLLPRTLHFDVLLGAADVVVWVALHRALEAHPSGRTRRLSCSRRTLSERVAES